MDTIQFIILVGLGIFFLFLLYNLWDYRYNPDNPCRTCQEEESIIADRQGTDDDFSKIKEPLIMNQYDNSDSESNISS